MSLTGASKTALSDLAAGLDDRIGSGFKIEGLVALSPWLLEARVRDRASDRTFEARLYPVPEAQWGELKQIWTEHAPAALDPVPKGLRKAMGLKRLGGAIAHLAETVPGLDLASYLRHVGQCRPEFAVRTLIELLDALIQLDSKGLHHFQIKPGNVIFTPDGHLVLKNAALFPFETAVAQLLGVKELVEPEYLAPEQLNGDPLTAATDIYQLGLLLYEMVTGRPPFIGDGDSVTDGQLTKAPPDPRTMNPGVGVGLTQILSRALAKSSEQRFGNLLEFKQVLAMLLPGAERARLTGKLTELDEKDLARLEEQLEEARDLCIKEEHSEALSQLDALLMAYGPREAILVMHREVWEVNHSEEIYRASERAVQLEKSQPAQALAHLNKVLSLAPMNPRAVSLQARIFGTLNELPPRVSSTLPINELKSSAHMASAEGNNPLSEMLWTLVLLYPQTMDAERRVAIHDAQMAAEAELRMMRGQSLPAEPEDASLDEPSLSGASVDQGGSTAPLSPVPPPAASKGKGKGKSNKTIMIAAGVALVLVLAVGGFLMMRMRNQAEYERQAGAAYAEADQTEKEGAWEQALVKWGSVTAAYPDFRDALTRQKTLEYKIRDRDQNIKTHLANARDLMKAGILYDDSGENAFVNLDKVLNLDPNNAEALLLMDELRTKEAAKVYAFWEDKKVLEASEALKRLRRVNPQFQNEELESGIAEWIKTKFEEPRMRQMQAAVQKGQWDRAFDLSDELRSHIIDPKVLDDYWNQLFEENRTRLLEAEEKKQLSTMLNALAVMSRIRPDDTDLIERRDRVSRELNKAKIEGLEKEILRLLSKNQVLTAAKKAEDLRKLDSKNLTADQATVAFRQSMENQIEAAEKAHDPKTMLRHYKTLVRVLPWRNFKTAGDKLAKQVATYDQAREAVLSGRDKPFEEQKPAIERFLKSQQSFTGDKDWGKVTALKELVLAEERRYNALVKWERGVADNPNVPYQDIVDKLQAEPAFKLAWPQKRLAAWRKAYQTKVDAFEGKVTLVIRGAKGLPKEKGRGKGLPDTFCELTVAGQSFKTAVVENDHNPVWDHACSFQTKPGDVLRFTISEVNNRQKVTESFGETTLKSIPKSIKGHVLQSREGWSLILDIRRER